MMGPDPMMMGMMEIQYDGTRSYDGYDGTRPYDDGHGSNDGTRSNDGVCQEWVL